MNKKNGIKASICQFEDRYASDFAKLNYEWLKRYFYVEEYDKMILENPRNQIIDKGGQILFAIVGNEVVGTVALIRRSEGVFELSKMGVTEDYKGMRIGQKLIYASIFFATQAGAHELFLDSNRKLKPAIALYQKVGFRECPVPADTPYERCDIRMQLLL